MLSVTPRDQEPQNDKITDVFRKPQLKMITPQNPNPVTCNPVIHAYSFDVRNSIPAVQQPRFYLDGGRRQEFPELRRLDSKFERAAKKNTEYDVLPRGPELGDNKLSSPWFPAY